MRTASRAIAEELPPREEDDPARGFANAILLAVPLWGIIGAVVWALM